MAEDPESRNSILTPLPSCLSSLSWPDLQLESASSSSLLWVGAMDGMDVSQTSVCPHPPSLPASASPLCLDSCPPIGKTILW